ncbi:hypothetical protein ACR6C2_05320 [Streptomyces sp. INA 01156]
MSTSGSGLPPGSLSGWVRGLPAGVPAAASGQAPVPARACRAGGRAADGLRLDLTVELADGATDGDELTADTGERPGDDVVGTGDPVTGDGPDLGETTGDGDGGVLPDLIDDVLLVGDLLLDGGEVGGEFAELFDDLPELSPVSTAEGTLSPDGHGDLEKGGVGATCPQGRKPASRGGGSQPLAWRRSRWRAAVRRVGRIPVGVMRSGFTHVAGLTPRPALLFVALWVPSVWASLGRMLFLRGAWLDVSRYCLTGGQQRTGGSL